MFSAAGVTGKVGSAAARKLLHEVREIRAPVRDRAEAGALEEALAEVANSTGYSRRWKN